MFYYADFIIDFSICHGVRLLRLIAKTSGFVRFSIRFVDDLEYFFSKRDCLLLDMIGNVYLTGGKA